MKCKLVHVRTDSCFFFHLILLFFNFYIFIREIMFTDWDLGSCSTCMQFFTQMENITIVVFRYWAHFMICVSLLHPSSRIVGPYQIWFLPIKLPIIRLQSSRVCLTSLLKCASSYNFQLIFCAYRDQLPCYVNAICLLVLIYTWGKESINSYQLQGSRVELGKKLRNILCWNKIN